MLTKSDFDKHVCPFKRGLIYLAVMFALSDCASHLPKEKTISVPPPSFQPTTAQIIPLNSNPPVITLHDLGKNHVRLYFQKNSAKLDNSDTELLNRFLTGIREIPYHHIQIVSFCDPSGTTHHNKKLGWERIESVQKFLITKGIAKNAMHMRYGGVPHDHKPSQWHEERRVDVYFTP